MFHKQKDLPLIKSPAHTVHGPPQRSAVCFCVKDVDGYWAPCSQRSTRDARKACENYLPNTPRSLWALMLLQSCNRLQTSAVILETHNTKPRFQISAINNWSIRAAAYVALLCQKVLGTCRARHFVQTTRINDSHPAPGGFQWWLCQ